MIKKAAMVIALTASVYAADGNVATMTDVKESLALILDEFDRIDKRNTEVDNKLEQFKKEAMESRVEMVKTCGSDEDELIKAYVEANQGYLAK